MVKKVKTEPPPGCIPEAEQPYPVPENWRWVRLSDSFHVRNDSEKKVQQKDYLEKGELPIIDQGQIFIGGYTNDLHMKYTGNLPVIIFGDHTRRIKYVDFPFAQGADGIKILQPKDYYMPKAFYYAMCNIYIPHRGYRRHFPLFKNYILPLPPLPEQQRIVDRIESLFNRLDAARAAAQSVVDEYELRRSAILYRAFTGTLTAGWREKHGVPDSSWKTERLEAYFEVTGGIQKQKTRIPKDNPVPYVTVANVFRNRIDLSDIRYFELFEGELEKYQLRNEDILVVEGNGSGNEIGRCAMWNAEIPVCVHQNHIIRVRKKDSCILPKYVLYYLNSPMGRNAMRIQAKTTAGLYNLSVGKVKSISFPMATTEEQFEIVSLLDSLLSKSPCRQRHHDK